MEKKNENIVQLYVNSFNKTYNTNIVIKYKYQSPLLRKLKPVIELYNKHYWEWYITTLGSTIYVTDDFFKSNIHECLSIIMHECIHVYQSKKQSTFLHSFLYLFPQSLSLFSLLAIFAIFLSTNFCWFLLFLLFLAPLPAPFRYKKELEAYRVDLLYNKHTEVFNKVSLMKLIVDNLSGASYYFCWPFKKQILKDIKKSNKLFKEKELYIFSSDFIIKNKSLIK